MQAFDSCEWGQRSLAIFALTSNFVIGGIPHRRSPADMFGVGRKVIVISKVMDGLCVMRADTTVRPRERKAQK